MVQRNIVGDTLSMIFVTFGIALSSRFSASFWLQIAVWYWFVSETEQIMKMLELRLVVIKQAMHIKFVWFCCRDRMGQNFACFESQHRESRGVWYCFGYVFFWVSVFSTFQWHIPVRDTHPTDTNMINTWLNDFALFVAAANLIQTSF